MEDALETDLVALQGGDGFAEELLGVLCSGLEAGNINLLPLNGNVVGLEDGLHGLCDLGSDTITRDEGNCVFGAILGRLAE